MARNKIVQKRVQRDRDEMKEITKTTANMHRIIFHMKVDVFFLFMGFSVHLGLVNMKLARAARRQKRMSFGQ